eukprot:3884612-Prymnesium_polylepis.1
MSSQHLLNERTTISDCPVQLNELVGACLKGRRKNGGTKLVSARQTTDKRDVDTSSKANDSTHAVTKRSRGSEFRAAPLSSRVRKPASATA